MNTEKWHDRGDSAAREDARAGNDLADIDEGAVLAHLGIFDETDTDARAYGLVGAELEAAQRAALAGYREAAEALVRPQGSPWRYRGSEGAIGACYGG